MCDDRCIGPDFLNALNTKALVAFKKKIEKNKNLELCFRGNDKAVNIYYNNQTVWKIYDKNKHGYYKVEVSVHESIDDTRRKSIYDQLEEKEFVIVSKFGNEQRYPYILRKEFNKEFVDSTFEILKPMIDLYFEGEQHIEKKRQQELFSSLDSKKDGYYVYDLELHQKGETLTNQNLPDLMALRFTGEKITALDLVEVKSTRAACRDKKSGIAEHIEGMCNYIDSGRMEARKEEAEHIVNAYRSLQIHVPPFEDTELDDGIRYGIALVLTDKALPYYMENYEEINREIEQILKSTIKKMTCEIFGWILNECTGEYRLKSFREFS